MPLQIQIKQEEIVMLLLDFCKQNNLFQTMRALEKETESSLEMLGRELGFFRDLVLDGQWEDAENFIAPMKGREDSFDHSRVLFQLRKQKFLELVYDQALSPAVVQLVDELKELEGKCSAEEFRSLCYCLTMKNLNDNPQFRDWTPMRGRLECFETVRPLFAVVYPPEWEARNVENARKMEPNRLLRVLKQSLLYQLSLFQAQQEDELALPNPLVLSLLRDLPTEPLQQGQDIQAFLAQHAVVAPPLQPPPKLKSALYKSHAVMSFASRVVEASQPPPSPHHASPVQPVQPSFVEPTVPPLSAAPTHAREPVSWTIASPGRTSPSPRQPRRVRQPKAHSPRPATSGRDRRSQAVEFEFVGVDRDNHPVRTVAFAPSGRAFATGSNSRVLRLYKTGGFGSNAPTMEATTRFVGHHVGSVYSVAWNGTSSLVATASNDHTVKVLPVTSQLTRAEDKKTLQLTQSGTVRSVAFRTFQPSQLLSGGADRVVRLWDCAHRFPDQPLLRMEGHSRAVFEVRSAPWHSGSAFSCSQDGTVRQWDLRSPPLARCVRVLHYGERIPVSACALHSDGKLVFAGLANGFCVCWDSGSGKVVWRVGVHSKDCRSLDLSPDNALLLAGSFDASVATVTARSGATAQKLHEHSDSVIQVRWSPTEAAFLSCSKDGSVRLWRAREPL